MKQHLQVKRETIILSMGKIKTRFISIADLEVQKGKRCLEHGAPEDLVIDLLYSCWQSQIHVSLYM